VHGAAAESQGAMSSNTACDLRFPRTIHEGAIDRILPISDETGLAAIWQQGEVINLQRYDRECKTQGKLVEVVRSQQFFVLPDENGLADATGIKKSGGATAIAWITGGEVWVSLVKAGAEEDEPVSKPMQANAASNYTRRADVRVVSGPHKDSGFIVAWSTWEQDSDGWGVFARYFDKSGQPVGKERQLNSAWRRFQWRPELQWCGRYVYAMWLSGTGSPCGITNPADDCANGPMIRPLDSPAAEEGIADQVNRIPEVDLGGVQPIEAAIGCMGEDEAVALWLQGGGSEVRWEFRQGASSQGSTVSSSSVPRSLSSASSVLEQYRSWAPSWMPPAITSSWASVRQLVEHYFLMHRGQSAMAGAQDQGWASLRPEGENGMMRGWRAPLEAEDTLSAASSLSGQSAVLTTSGVMVLLKSSMYGELSVQLLDYASEWGPVAYPPHVAATGVSQPRAVWDHPAEGPPALLMCSLKGGGAGGGDAEYICLYRGVLWLAYANGLGLGMPLTIQMAIYAILVVCCLGIHCVARAAFALEMQRHGVRPPRQRRQVREFMTQLAEIPSTPPASPTSRSPAAATDEEETPDGGAAICFMCHNEVFVRVGFRPCGHTACRDCTARLVETDPKCEQCQATITGLQPVYL